MYAARPVPVCAFVTVTPAPTPYFQAVPVATPTSVPTSEPEIQPVSIAWLPPTVGRWASEIEAAAARHGIDPNLLAIITLVESGGNPNAVSPSGAIGLVQVMPATALDIARQRGVALGDQTNPVTNLDFGAWYLAAQLRAFGQRDDPDWRTSVDRAAAAYNGGPGSVRRWLAGGSLPAEAQRYRTYVTGMWAERALASSPMYERWLAAGGSALVAAADVPTR